MGEELLKGSLVCDCCGLESGVVADYGIEEEGSIFFCGCSGEFCRCCLPPPPRRKQGSCRH